MASTDEDAMPLLTRIASVAALSVLTASPCFALSVVRAPENSDAGSRLVDPDEALTRPFAQFISSSQVGEKPALSHGPMVTYDLSAPAHAAKAGSGYDAMVRRPGDPQFNPFVSDMFAEPARASAGR
jgi:hypothetical protein